MALNNTPSSIWLQCADSLAHAFMAYGLIPTATTLPPTRDLSDRGQTTQAEQPAQQTAVRVPEGHLLQIIIEVRPVIVGDQQPFAATPSASNTCPVSLRPLRLAR